MTAVRRPNASGRPGQGLLTKVSIFVVLFILVVYLSVIPDSNNNNNSNSNNSHALTDTTAASTSTYTKQNTFSSLKGAVLHKRQEIQHALSSLTTSNLPHRLVSLRDKHEIVGERLAEVRAGTETVEEILHGHVANSVSVNDGGDSDSDKPPMQLAEIIDYLDAWIHQLHEKLMQAKHATFEGIWQAYHDLTVQTLYPWDREYLSRMPARRDDGSIFLSVATYRDENCFNVRFLLSCLSCPSSLSCPSCLSGPSFFSFFPSRGLHCAL
jgi:hypothetical protein